MNPEAKEHIILGNPEREQILDESLQVWLENLGPDADNPGFWNDGGAVLSPRRHVAQILDRTPYGVSAIETYERFIREQPRSRLGFEDLIQSLIMPKPKPLIESID